jgi:hypothetical protein
MSTLLQTEIIIARAALAYFAELPGQDDSMTIEMAEAMMDDLVVNGELGEMLAYVRRYCTVIDGPDEAKLIVLGITEILDPATHAAPPPDDTYQYPAHPVSECRSDFCGRDGSEEMLDRKPVILEIDPATAKRLADDGV